MTSSTCPPSDADADTEAPLLLSVARWLGYLGLLVGAGVALFAALFLPSSASADAARARLRRTAGVAAVVAVVGWWAAVPLVALYQLGLPASALGDGATWSALAAEEYAVPLAVTVGLGLAVLALPVRAPDRRRAGLVSSAARSPSPHRRSPGTRARQARRRW